MAAKTVMLQEVINVAHWIHSCDSCGKELPISKETPYRYPVGWSEVIVKIGCMTHTSYRICDECTLNKLGLKPVLQQM